MGFIYPQVLWLFVALIPLLAVWTFVRRGRDTRLSKFMVRENWSLLNNQVSSQARFHKAILILLTLSFSILAAARPYWGERERTVQTRGVNIIFAVDISSSMRAEDIKSDGAAQIQRRDDRDSNPSRLEAAKTLIRQILAELPGQRIALLPFAGESFLQVPMTSDYSILYDMTRELDYNTIASPGTAFPDMIDTAIEAFDRTETGGSRALVVFTDGEDHSAEIREAARRANEAGIRIFALGIGSPEGAPIRMEDGNFKKDRQGRTVLSTLNTELLRDLANQTGGRAYVAGATGMIDPSAIIGDLKQLETAEFDEERRVVREERYQWPLALALLCMTVEMLIHDRRRTKKEKSRRRFGGHQTEGASA